ncbi:beta-N-acetylhexosaminidase [Streptomyces radicis]|uniref:Beta-N-acetylglucosaminidase n=1 Tax=Streptomyces radicis TaxID=1750517 RepID=A0A3A9WGK1_9ACTN|nr:glycoside hydrolase family 20 protein [Streptomyces radicis]RKN05227.1 beta-N-acetylglucosaminidase [Streptomyces radicis]RKN16760.1 beta-N-acetylglucosaminidase [Streptomyces radicis]
MRQAHWRIFALVAAVLVIVAGAVVTLTTGDDDAPPEREPGGSVAAAQPTGPEGPIESIPSVRSFDAASGRGWAPGEETRVVADEDGPLDDEADRLADELDVPRADEGGRQGDVILGIDDRANTGGEGYTLVTEDHRVRIVGRTEAGVFYGTRTLMQSVRANGGTPEGTVTDRPDRPQRGLMIDIARKPFSADWIEDRLREMADLKLNQLQLHLSDDQGFRIESESHPEVVSDEHLTKREVRDIVRLAESLHIEVIPEIDSPGHLGAVLEAHPDLQLRRADGGAAEGAINIADPAAGRLIDELLREYRDLFPARFWHLGGDEYAALLSSDPEATYPGLARAARDRYGDDATVRDLATGWLNDRAEVVTDLDRTPQVWNDGMHADGVVEPSEDRQVAYWTGREQGARPPIEYLDEGFELVNFNSEFLYYVLGQPNGFTYPTGQRIFEEWTPDVLRGTSPVPDRFANADHVPGGRFAVWCDLADAQTPDEVAAGIRLPLRAVSQKLWDPSRPDRTWEEFAELADRVGGRG